jgi:hypothetical protein
VGVLSRRALCAIIDEEMNTGTEDEVASEESSSYQNRVQFKR